MTKIENDLGAISTHIGSREVLGPEKREEVGLVTDGRTEAVTLTKEHQRGFEVVVTILPKGKTKP